MIKYLDEKVQKITKPAIIIITGVLFVIMLFAVKGKPFGIEQLKEITEGICPLDTMRNYSADAVYTTLEQMGQNGRAFYTQILLTVELFFPFVFRFFIILLLSLQFKYLLPQDSPWRRFCLLPVISSLADYLENISVLIILFNYPKEITLVTKILPFFSRIKWIFSYIDVALVLVLLLIIVIRQILYSVKRKRVHNE